MNNILKTHFVGAVVFCVAWGYSAGIFAGAGEATRVVTDLQESLIAIMKEGRELGYTGRYETISPAVQRTLDLENIARLTVGRHWKRLNETQRSDFVETFHDLSISMYASRFKNYSGERFNVLSEESLPKGHRKRVVGHFVKSDGETITFNYILHRKNERWKIINISVNGVSDLALKRAEYGGILRTDGFSTLLQRLKTQIRENTHGR